MFSPYYAAARRRNEGRAEARNHVALNVCLYGARGKRWAMTERGRGALRQDAGVLGIGPSQLSWDGRALSFEIDEIAVPLPTRLRGRVTVVPDALVNHPCVLDRAGQHVWSPIAPRARVEVAFDKPNLRWSGAGYCDSNFGEEPLERRIKRWSWSRGGLPDGSTAVLYDVLERGAEQTALALQFANDGSVRAFESPAAQVLPRSGWRIARATRSEDGVPRVLRTLEDTPFYARSIVAHRLCGSDVQSVHESLDLDRFGSRTVQLMLPFRMPRLSG